MIQLDIQILSSLLVGKLYSHSRDEAVEVLHLSAEQQVSELSEGKEDDEEHDGKASEVLGTARQCGGKLSHGLVEADVLEDLDPGAENHDSERVVKAHLCVAQEVEVSKLVWILEQSVQLVVDCHVSINVVSDTANCYDDDHDVQNIPEGLEVLQLVLLNLSDTHRHNRIHC